MTTAMNAVPRQKAAMASMMINLIQQVAGAVGIAILSTVLNNRTKFHLSVMGEKINATAPIFLDTVKNRFLKP